MYLSEGLLLPWVIFSLIWSIGCTCDNDGRIRFDEWLRDKMTKRKYALPSEGLVYDYKYIYKKYMFRFLSRFLSYSQIA